jgi:hypothetical protein
MSNLGAAITVLGSLIWLYVAALTSRETKPPGQPQQWSDSPNLSDLPPECPVGATPARNGNSGPCAVFRGQISPLSQ